MTSYPPPPAQYYGGPPGGEAYAVGGQQQYGGQYGQPVTSQPQTNMVIVQQQPQPETHLIMSIITCLFCNWICGLFGIYYSLQSDSAYKGGRIQEAEQHGKSAKKCNIIGIVCGVIAIVGTIVFVILYVVVFAASVGAAVNQVNQNDWWNNNN